MLEILSLARRDLKKWWKSKFSILTTLIRPLSWLLLFGKAFNPLSLVSSGASNQAGSPGTLSLNLGGAPDYFSFMAAGMLSIMVLQLSMRGMNSMVFDRYLGFLDKVLASPIRREGVILSKVVASVVRGLVQALVLFATALLLGMRVAGSFGFTDLLAVVGVLVVLSFGLSAIFTSIGSVIRKWETSEAVASVLLFPIMFTSSVLYPTRSMPFWLQPFALANPVTHSTEILRDVLYGSAGDTEGLFFHVELLAAFALFSLALVFVASLRMSSSR